MTKTTKRDRLRPLIFEALKEKRTVPEVKRYIREKYGSELEPHARTVYHHIGNVREKEKELGWRLVEEGDKYQIISIEEENTVDSQHLLWFIDKYDDALEQGDQIELYQLRTELEHLCCRHSLRIYDERFIDFLIENVKRDSYEFFSNKGLNLDRMTLVTWECVVCLANKLEKQYGENDKLYKKLRKLDNFFEDIALDYDRKYGVERLEAFIKLASLNNSPHLFVVAFFLLKYTDPKRKIVFSPGKIIRTNEYDLFKYQIKYTILRYLMQWPLDCRQTLFEIYQVRKKAFGKNDRISKDILLYIDMTRDLKIKQWADDIREFEKMMKEYKEQGIDISKIGDDKRYKDLLKRHEIRNL